MEQKEELVNSDREKDSVYACWFKEAGMQAALRS